MQDIVPVEVEAELMREVTFTFPPLAQPKAQQMEDEVTRHLLVKEARVYRIGWGYDALMVSARWPFSTALPRLYQSFVIPGVWEAIAHAHDASGVSLTMAKPFGDGVTRLEYLPPPMTEAELCSDMFGLRPWI